MKLLDVCRGASAARHKQQGTDKGVCCCCMVGSEGWNVHTHISSANREAFIAWQWAAHMT